MANELATLLTGASGPGGLAAVMGWLYWKERKAKEDVSTKYEELLKAHSDLFKELWLRAEED